jgi:hypothetical protein
MELESPEQLKMPGAATEKKPHRANPVEGQGVANIPQSSDWGSGGATFQNVARRTDFGGRETY